jgi:hypothetical protein
MSAMEDRAALAALVAEGDESWPAPAGFGVGASDASIGGQATAGRRGRLWT